MIRASRPYEMLYCKLKFEIFVGCKSAEELHLIHQVCLKIFKLKSVYKAVTLSKKKKPGKIEKSQQKPPPEASWDLDLIVH